MTRETASRKRNKLAATLARSADILRGLPERARPFTAPLSQSNGACGEGHPQWVPQTNALRGVEDRQLSLRPKYPQVSPERYRQK